MRNYQPKYRWSISTEQVLVLRKMYRFRFVTSGLLAEDLQKDRSTIYERLSVLEKQGYIAKQYDSTYHLRTKPASYCLAPRGIRHLKQLEGINQLTLHNFYKNRRQTEEKIDLCLYVYRLYLLLKKTYGTNWDILTKHEIDRNCHIRPTPELILASNNDSCPAYYVEFAPKGIMSWLLRRRINQHEDGAYEHRGTPYPHVLFIAGNNNTERRLVELTRERYNDFSYFITTEQRLFSATDGAAWVQSDAWYEGEEPQFTPLPDRFEE